VSIGKQSHQQQLYDCSLPTITREIFSTIFLHNSNFKRCSPVTSDTISSCVVKGGLSGDVCQDMAPLRRKAIFSEHWCRRW